MSVYDELFVPRLFGPWAEVLLDEVGVPAGAVVLDVATGPGTVARRAAVRAGAAGRVIGCDLSPAMLAVARAKPPEPGAAPITYQECPADGLTVPDGAFDIGLCQQGLQFFPDRVKALGEMYRALRPGGRVGAAVWCAIAECPAFEATGVALGAVFGPEAEQAYRSGPWGLPDPEELARLFEAAGFGDVAVAHRTRPVVFEGGPPQMVSLLAPTTIAPQVAALDEVGRADLLAAFTRALAPLMEDGAVRSEAAAHLVVATR